VGGAYPGDGPGTNGGGGRLKRPRGNWDWQVSKKSKKNQKVDTKAKVRRGAATGKSFSLGGERGYVWKFRRNGWRAGHRGGVATQPNKKCKKKVVRGDDGVGLRKRSKGVI